jgi:ankyrin repeat protein
MAAVNSHPEAIPMLLAHGADINAADQSGLSALHAAAAMGLTDVVQLLVQSGADREQLTSSGLTALDIAEAGGHTQIADFLRQFTEPRA